MRAIWLEDLNLSIRDDLPIPKPREGETLVRVRLAGICNTDLEMVKGYYPFTGILGHEFVGKVIETPDPSMHVDNRFASSERKVACEIPQV